MDVRKSKSFCVLPWIHINNPTSTDEVSVCCKWSGTPFKMNDDCKTTIANSEQYKTIKRGQHENRWVPECKKCLVAEKNNVISDRQNFNEIFKSCIDDNSFRDLPLKFIEIAFSNVCNFSCRMCNSNYSSKWLSYEKKLSDNDIKVHLPLQKTKSKQIDDFSQFKDLTLIKLMGGEPLYQRETMEFFDKLEQVTELWKVDVFVISNGSVFFDDKWMELIGKLKSVTITLSIDGTDKVAEYIREGTNWSTINKNIQKFIDLSTKVDNFFVNVNSTTMVYNIFYYNEIKEYLKSLNVPYYFNLLHHQWYLNMNLLPLEIKYELKEKINDAYIIDHLMTEPPEGTFDKFMLYTTEVDKLFGKNINDYLPEFTELLGRHGYRFK